MAPARALSSSSRPKASSVSRARSKGAASSSTTSTSKGQQPLLFSSTPPNRSSLQTKLAFGPAPLEPSKKRVRIEEPPANDKGKGKAADSESEDAKQGLWSVLYAPSTRSDLAVHHRKVKDVERWLRDAFDGPPSLKKLRRLLILTGPTGSAKTETIRQLSSSSEVDFELVEWKTETTARSGESLTDGEDFASVTTRFRDFFSRSSKFRTLSLNTTQHKPDEDHTGSSSNIQTSSLSSSMSTPKKMRRLILLEDLPNLSHPATLQFFQGVLATQLTATLDPNGNHTPICIILSDMSGTSGGLLEDGSTGDDRMRRETDWIRPRRLLGEELSRNDSWLEIKFNPIAPTLLKMGLKATLQKASRAARGRLAKGRERKGGRDFPPDLIDIIAEVSDGDIRSAVDTLQHVYTAFETDPKRFEAMGKAKSKKGDEVAKKAARELLESLGVAGRDSSLDLFHALGKILWNKRMGDGDDTDEALREEELTIDALPPHLSYLERRRSTVDVKALASSSVDTSILQLFSHHNYPAFCSEIDQCEGIIEGFSFSDSNIKVKGSDVYSTLPLSEHYSFLITTHATLLHLPSPVEKKGQRPTKPALFEINARCRAHRERLEEVKRGMKWGLKSGKEIAEEMVPMVGKILASSSSFSSSGSKKRFESSGSVANTMQPAKDGVIRLLSDFDFSVFSRQQGGVDLFLEGSSGKAGRWKGRREEEEEQEEESVGDVEVDGYLDSSGGGGTGGELPQLREVERQGGGLPLSVSLGMDMVEKGEELEEEEEEEEEDRDGDREEEEDEIEDF